MSKYQEVVEDIIHKIENNEYTDKLPTEDQLIEQYQVCLLYTSPSPRD